MSSSFDFLEVLEVFEFFRGLVDLTPLGSLRAADVLEILGNCAPKEGVA